MRARRTIQEHWIRVHNHHTKCPNRCLSILKGNVTTVNASGHRCTSRVCSALRNRMIPVAELELYDVADGRDHRVWREGILRASHHDGNDGVGARFGVHCCQSAHSRQPSLPCHTPRSPDLRYIADFDHGNALAVDTSRTNPSITFIVVVLHRLSATRKFRQRNESTRAAQRQLSFKEQD